MRVMMALMKVCNKCGLEKPHVDFYKHKLTSDGLRGECKSCIKLHNQSYHKENKERNNQRNTEYYWNNLDISKKRVKKYREKYPEKKAELDKQYRLAHPERGSKYRHKRRAMKLNNGTFVVTNKELKKIYNSPCIYCGSLDNITNEHVMPLSKGGVDGIGNLAPACLSCNTSKGGRTVMEWRISKIRQAKID